MFDDLEFLLVSRSIDDVHLDRDVVDILEVSDLSAWQARIGVTIESVGVSRHTQGDGCGESIWAFRVNLANSDSFVIALGEVRDGIPVYLPDSIVVLFARDAAKALSHRGSLASAWGVTLE
jgi:hypothetical protein